MSVENGVKLEVGRRLSARGYRLAGMGLLSLLGASAGAQARSFAPATEARPIEVELVSPSRTVVPGETTWVAVRLKPNKGWHTYWHHAGDVGSAPSIEWKLAAGWTAGAFHWPTPHRISSPPLASYGYERELLLMAPIHVPRDARIGSTARIGGTLTWVVCANECIADEVDLAISRPVAANAVVDPSVMKAFVAERERMPQGGWSAASVVDSAEVVLLARPPASWTPPGARGQKGPALPTDFFADSASVIDHAAPITIRWVDSLVELRMKRSAYANGTPGLVSGVLIFGHADSVGSGDNHAFALSGPVATSIAEARTDLGVSATESAPISMKALLTAALLGLLGGTLLNLMPCVLPVLSIKLFGLAEMASQPGRAARRHALLFGGGVLLSMWALVGMLLAIRAAGNEIGWGYQLQSPVVVSLLALVMVGAALNMAGVFTIGPVGGGLLAVADRRSGPIQDILSGALVVLLATPCSAPFISSAAGYALASGAVPAFTVFTAIAIGLAWPVVLVAFAPSVQRLVPRPGPWMLTLRQFLVFPLLATAAWLAWVVGRQAGVDVMGALLGAMTILGLSLWLFDRLSKSPSRTVRYSGIAVSGVALAGAVGIAVLAALAVKPAEVTTPGAAEMAAGELEWQPFSDSTLLVARQSGAAVMLDVTADWCLTCKVNDRVAFAPARVRTALDSAKVQLIRADWTSRSPAITRLINGFGRSGVPVVVLYPPGAQSEPVLLPTLLTPGIVLRALETMPGAAIALTETARVADSTRTSSPIRQ